MYVKIKHKLKLLKMNLTKISIIGVLFVGITAIAIQLVSFNNHEIDLRNQFDATLLARTSFYDNMHKTISQKVQISNKVDDSFKENINIIMDGRKDSEQVMMKWIKETNPNANFEQVAEMYKDLSRTIEAKRSEFVNRETKLADLQREHKTYIQRFPNSMYNMFFDRKPLEFKVIQSEETMKVMESGVDNNIELDL